MFWVVVMLRKNKVSKCPIEKTVSIIGKKWTLLILKELHCTQKPLRFNELKKNLVGITSAVLSKRLSELEAEGLLNRNVLTKNPPLKVVYDLTAKGRSLQDIIECLKSWGKEWASRDGDSLKDCSKCLL